MARREDHAGSELAIVVQARGNGAGALYPPVRIATGWNIVAKVLSPGDFSGDRRSDLVGVKANGEVWLYRGSGAGAFGAASRIATGWNVFTTLF